MSRLTPGHALSKSLIVNWLFLQLNDGFNHLGLRAFGRGCPAHSALEFPVSEFQDVEQKVYQVPGIMFSLMPSLRAEFKCLVISFFVLFYQPLRADIASYVVTKLIATEQQEQARDAPVTVTKRMNAEKVQIENGEGN